jgi:hypothetical protein
MDMTKILIFDLVQLDQYDWSLPLMSGGDGSFSTEYILTVSGTFYLLIYHGTRGRLQL